jgi:hypothetical protein
VSFKVYFGLCHLVLIWGWLGGVCLVSIQSCCSVNLVLVWCFFRVVMGSIECWFRLSSGVVFKPNSGFVM